MGRDRDGHKTQVGGAVSQRAGDLAPGDLPWPLQIWPLGQAALGEGTGQGAKPRGRGPGSLTGRGSLGEAGSVLRGPCPFTLGLLL